ncbi:hypothetical protein BT93_L4524 [Corymbia citriodora subsp. variegata]|uniref:adenylate kinase n=1 Tax=Corymbia citriodora subsp. variegata TaxID=360336 RepID=A0A8T0CJR2_CORYI|nr:hypothetical protein BT93_L4524 [Corymbia citriodora subsp. variegata]
MRQKPEVKSQFVIYEGAGHGFAVRADPGNEKVSKGTQTERLITRYPQLASIATGDLLRDHVKRKTDVGEQANAFMKSGKLVPDPLILNLILTELTDRKWLQSSKSNERIMKDLEKQGDPSETAVQPSDDPDTSFILDGFPRTATQADALARLLPMNLVFHLVTPIEIVLKRMASRWTHLASGRVYNVGFNDPKVAGKDDVTGEDLVQREDDSEATWRKRLTTFDETSVPLLDYYRKKHPEMVVEVAGNSSNEISPRIYSEIERRFC